MDNVTISPATPAYHLPPGPKGLPFFGSVLALRRDMLGFFRNLNTTYGSPATYYIFKYHSTFVGDPAGIRTILIDNARNFTHREVYWSLQTLLGNGLLNIDGEFHRQQRRLVQPAFHKRRVESYASVMTDCTQDEVARWQIGEIRHVARDMQHLTLRIVAKTLFSLDLDAEGDDIGEAFDAALEYINDIDISLLDRALGALPGSRRRRFEAAKHKLDALIARAIAEHRDTTDNGDVLSMLLAARDEQGNALTDQQIRDQMMTLISAGHETTANTLSWTLLLLSDNPQVRQKLVRELTDVLGGRAATVADLASLPYLDLVVKESLRLYPPAWSIGRFSQEDYRLEGYTIPGKTHLFLGIDTMHHDPRYWTQPERFWPERFSPEHNEPLVEGAYLPFGAGTRICIGMPFALMEARLILATILQHCTPILATGQRIVPQTMVTIRPKGGLPMRILPSECAT